MWDVVLHGRHTGWQGSKSHEYSCSSRPRPNNAGPRYLSAQAEACEGLIGYEAPPDTVKLAKDFLLQCSKIRRRMYRIDSTPYH